MPTCYAYDQASVNDDWTQTTATAAAPASEEEAEAPKSRQTVGSSELQLDCRPPSLPHCIYDDQDPRLGTDGGVGVPPDVIATSDIGKFTPDVVVIPRLHPAKTLTATASSHSVTLSSPSSSFPMAVTTTSEHPYVESSSLPMITTMSTTSLPFVNNCDDNGGRFPTKKSGGRASSRRTGATADDLRSVDSLSDDYCDKVIDEAFGEIINPVYEEETGGEEDEFVEHLV